MAQTLQVKIISPKKDLFQGPATSVSSTNSTGKCDILPEHANFITIIDHSPILIRTADKNILTFNFPLAIIHIQNDQVRIYTEFSTTL